MTNFRDYREKSQEKEKEYTSRIVLSLFRHGEKEKNPPEGKTGDAEVRLTPAGRKGALAKGNLFRLPEEGIGQALAKGSPRKRAQETAAFVMAGKEETITGDETLEEMKEKLDKGRAYGSKIGTDPRLDFSMGEGEFTTGLMAAAKAGNLLEWMVNESDDLAKKTHEAKGTTYSRAARDVAEIVAKYYRASNRFDELVGDKGYADTMQRFLGSHQTVTECFLAKIVERSRDKAKRDKLVAAMKNGFDFVDGYQVEIQNNDGERKMYIRFQKQDKDGKILLSFDDEILPEDLAWIIQEGEELDLDTVSESK